MVSSTAPLISHYTSHAHPFAELPDTYVNWRTQLKSQSNRILSLFLELCTTSVYVHSEKHATNMPKEAKSVYIRAMIG